MEKFLIRIYTTHGMMFEIVGDNGTLDFLRWQEEKGIIDSYDMNVIDDLSFNS